MELKDVLREIKSIIDDTDWSQFDDLEMSLAEIDAIVREALGDPQNAI